MMSIFEFFKHRVRKKKRRFNESGFDLDLTCTLSMCGFARMYGIYGILTSFLSYYPIWPKVSAGCMQRSRYRWFVREITETVRSTRSLLISVFVDFHCIAKS